MPGPITNFLEEDGAVIAKLEGEIDVSNTRTLHEELLNRVGQDAAGLVVDLTKVSYIDSSGVQMFFDLMKKLNVHRQSLAIALPGSSPIRRLMKITHLDESVIFGESAEVCAENLRAAWH